MERYLKAGNPNTLAVNNLIVPAREIYFKKLRNSKEANYGVMNTPESLLAGQRILADIIAEPNYLQDKTRISALNDMFGMYLGAMPDFKKRELFKNIGIDGVQAMEKEFSVIQQIADKLHSLPDSVIEENNANVNKEVESFDSFKLRMLATLEKAEKESDGSGTNKYRIPSDDEIRKAYNKQVLGQK
jgi:hypothetical protein